MSDLSDWSLVATSAGLIFATFLLYLSNKRLSKHTSNLVAATNQLKAATDKLGRLQVAPNLSFGAPAIVGGRSGRGTDMRFPVVNKGLGSARIASLRGTINGNRDASFTPATPGDPVLAPGEPYSYDIEEVAHGDSVLIEVDYEDVDGNKYTAKQTLEA
ncbi:MAG: hypothetical protein KGI38_00455 [Thaumarchaeota archaeon]|nr:hypothetical protein [Nitrososphaerota archaeon]